MNEARVACIPEELVRVGERVGTQNRVVHHDHQEQQQENLTAVCFGHATLSLPWINLITWRYDCKSYKKNSTNVLFRFRMFLLRWTNYSLRGGKGGQSHCHKHIPISEVRGATLDRCWLLAWILCDRWNKHSTDTYPAKSGRWNVEREL